MKFRIWNKKLKQFIEKTCYINCNGKIFTTSMSVNRLGGYTQNLRSIDPNDCVIKLFSGVEDIEGSEIYSGDTVMSKDGGKFYVEFIDGSFGLSLKHGDIPQILSRNLVECLELKIISTEPKLVVDKKTKPS